MRRPLFLSGFDIDSFGFRVTDGLTASLIDADVTIDITPVPTNPISSNVTVSGQLENTPFAIILSGYSPDGNPISSDANARNAGLNHLKAVIDMCRAIMFPGYAGTDVARVDPAQLRALVVVRVGELSRELQDQVYRALHHKRQQALGKTGEATDAVCADCNAKAKAIVDRQPSG